MPPKKPSKNSENFAETQLPTKRIEKTKRVSLREKGKTADGEEKEVIAPKKPRNSAKTVAKNTSLKKGKSNNATNKDKDEKEIEESLGSSAEQQTPVFSLQTTNNGYGNYVLYPVMNPGSLYRSDLHSSSAAQTNSDIEKLMQENKTLKEVRTMGTLS